MASVVLIVLYVVASMVITIAGVLHIIAPSLPQFFKDLLLYGKANKKRKEWSFVRLFEVPKSWFLHFYMLGVLVNGFMLYVTATCYMTGQSPPAKVKSILDKLVSKPELHTRAGSAILLIAMMLIQNSRRLYECLFVSVYSKGNMNLAHYALGLILYSTFSFAVLSEAPVLGKHRVFDLVQEMAQFSNFAGLLLFLWASYQHHVVHVIFANLRKDRQGKVQTTAHSIPMGGWFDYVSCPHYFAEILIYVAFMVVGGIGHRTLLAIVLFVVDNQIVAGYITHIWYKQEFQSRYPADRKAVIPFLL